MAKTKEDYKRMLDKLKEQSAGSGNTKFEYLDLKEGKNNVRVLPGHPNMEGFFVEKWQHGKTDAGKYVTVICLNHGDKRSNECLICSEELEELRTSKDKDDKVRYNSLKDKPRYFMNVVSRDQDDKVLTLPCGPQILQGILEIYTNEDYGNIMDPQEGRDVIITKTGKGMETDYTVLPRGKSTPLFDDDAEIDKLIGTSAEDTQIPDLTDIPKEFEGEPENALFVWQHGWQKFGEKVKAEGGGKEEKAKPAAGKPAAATKKPPVEPEEDEEEAPITSYPPLKSRCSECGEKRFKTPTGNLCPHGHKVPQLAEGEQPKHPSKAYLKEFPLVEAEPDVTSFPKLKSRCSVCGEHRYKTPSGNVCANGHGDAPPLAEGARPSKPSKAFLAEFPEPADEEEEEAPVPTKAAAGKPATSAAASTSRSAKGGTATATSPSEDEEEGLDDLDAIIAQHTKAKK